MVITDLTEQKNTELELKKHRDHLEELVSKRTKDLEIMLDSSPALIFYKDIKNRLLRVNKAFEKAMGIPKRDLDGKSLFDIYSKKQADAYWKDDLEVIKTGKARRGIIETMDTPQGIRIVETTKIPHYEENGKITGIIGFAIDITERRRLEDELKRYNEALEKKVSARTRELDVERQRLYGVLETLPVYVVLLDKDYRVPFANKFFRERFGESRGRRCYEYLFNKNAECENCETYKVMKTGAPHHWEWLGPDGRNYDIYDFPFKDTDGSDMIMEMGIDITEQKRAAAAVEAERKRFYSVLETLPAMVCLLTPDHRVSFANKTFRDKFGESHGRRCYEQCFGKKEPCDFCQTYKVLETGKPHHWEVNCPDGSILEAYDFPFTDIDGSPLILEMDVDITAFRKIQKDLLYAQVEMEKAKRLSDIGTLAATVAHELRNPLAAIKMAQYNIKRKAKDDSLDKHLANIETKLVESEQIISNLLSFSRIKMPHFSRINIYNILNACINEAKDHFSKHAVRIKKRTESIKDLLIEADPVQIKEIFSNILNNAFDALGISKGIIEITAQIDKEQAAISIRDNGAGIGKEVLEKVFEPFFTTKAKGTGLGLSVCQQMAHLHGGMIQIVSQEGQGTTVTIILPIEQKYRRNV